MKDTKLTNFLNVFRNIPSIGKGNSSQKNQISSTANAANGSATESCENSKSTTVSFNHIKDNIIMTSLKCSLFGWLMGLE